MNYLFHVEIMLTVINVYYPIPTRENKEHPGNFQNKSVSPAFD